jgi:chromate transporter
MNGVGGINASVVGLLLAALYNPVFISGIHSWMDGLIALVGYLLLRTVKLSPFVIVICCVIFSVISSSLF